VIFLMVAHLAKLDVQLVPDHELNCLGSFRL
jgi:hypothetical protein